ncbi:DUF2252 domain-containing protein [Yinghuangia seranimata]|uniref:DUF2252 domain-containing protein n=1 Tax=Yinghuangia seranimata TaxID=408067 RepID=UPI00248C62CF|nr:DUF2252 domain-containing protein [Yinghuangia seranimata]MDI2131942.1 DUF2252 domain-containing protein [Yinghuangia seranimata]
MAVVEIPAVEEDGAVPLQGRDFVVPGFRVRGDVTAKARGKALRKALSRAEHRRFEPGAERPAVLDVVEQANVGRLPHLVPIRIGRMVATPFAFLRGSAGLMAADLARTPVSGVTAQICGDAHAGNFGLFGSSDGRLVMDLNDFDETTPGPWEWDLKRLAASLVVAGRVGGASEEVCRDAAQDAAEAYRKTMALLAGMPVLQAWQAIADESLVWHAEAHDITGLLDQVSAKARKNTSAKVAARSTVELEDGRRRFVPDPPVLTTVDDATAEAVAQSLAGYVHTLSPERRPMFDRFVVEDVAFRVVGTGSVGLRAYVVMLEGSGDEPLVLQVKESRRSVLAPYLGIGDDEHEGRRVVFGQKIMQAVTDSLLGWTTVDGLPFQVRQFRNMKGSIDASTLPAEQLDDYARMTGTLLARAHSHSVDPKLLAGYCGKNAKLDEAIADFAVAYADQTERDHEQLEAAVKSGRVAAETGV